MTQMYDAIIVGAGISGLGLACRLREKNKNFLILEKSAGVGGRLATRRDQDCTFDHGAQFLKSDPQNRAPWHELINPNELGKSWFSEDGVQQLAFPNGMTSLAKSLANLNEIRLKEKVITITEQNNLCVLEIESGQKYTTRKVYLTAPLPQSLDLLKDSKIAYPQELENIPYASALVGLFRLDSNEKNILDLNYLQNVSPEIFTISNQLSKEVSRNLAFTVVMQPTWSEKYFSEEDSSTLLKISYLFQNFLSQKGGQGTSSILNSQLKKWRYSHPLKIFEDPFKALGSAENIILMGDAFGGASINGALHSAWSVVL